MIEYFLQQMVNGLTLGAIYGLIAIGYTMVYGIIGMINFAHGEVYMIGAFIGLITFLMLGFGGTPLVSVPVALGLVMIVSMAFTAVWGWAIERIAYRPVQGTFKLAALISAMGMSIFLQNFVQLTQGARTKPLPPLISGTTNITLLHGDRLDVTISIWQIMIILLTIALMTGFTLLIHRTSLGRQQRACEQDRRMAALLGIDVNRTISLTFVMGAALAAVAGVMAVLYYGVIDFYIGFLVGMKAFTAAVLGGIGSLPGAMLGGVLIGLIETCWAGYFPGEYKDVAAFGILILVLIFRPAGLLGKPEIEKV